MKKILVIGSLNVDIVAKVNNIPRPGETISCNLSQQFFGGKGANQAYAIAKAGVSVSMVGKVGIDNQGDKVVANLNSVGVNTEHILRTEDYDTGYAFITVDSDGENAIVVVKGANQNLTIEDIKGIEKIFDEHDFILIQQEIPMETVAYIIELAYEKGKKIILNPAPANELADSVLEKVDIITPNKTELSVLVGEDINTNVEENIKVLGQKKVKEIIVTLGSQGVVYYKDGNFEKYEPYKAEVIDTTGAGDCFNGYLVAALAYGKSMEEAIDWGQKAAAISIGKIGAQSSTPTHEQMMNTDLKKR